jgi:hypothetical protein
MMNVIRVLLCAFSVVIVAGCGQKNSSDGADSEPRAASDADTDSDTDGDATEDTIFDHEDTNATDLSDEAIANVVSELKVAYWHTSHGSQIISGTDAMAAVDERFAHSLDGSTGLLMDDTIGNYGQPCQDLSACSDNSAMIADTARILGENPEINVVMWAWCSINGHDVDTYLSNMETLISQFGPGGTDPRAATTPVAFIFMTAHSEGTNSFPREAAAQIRTHCETNDRWLIDYYDIESHDMAGTSYADLNIRDNLNYDGGNWAVEYLSSQDADATLTPLTEETSTCAHSESPTEAKLNCVLKAQAFWNALVQIADTI